jgi:hypothetical protein
MNKGSTLDHALQYRNEFNFSVIPVSHDKRPLIKWEKYQSEKATPEEIKEWYTKWPDANVGIVTGEISNLAVIDVDTKEGIQAIEEYLPDSVSLPTVQTPKGGRHHYFRCPEPPLVNNSRTITGCDLRCNGGYIVAPPSTNGTGKAYEWIVGIDSTGDIPELPGAYIERVVAASGRTVFNNNSLYSNCDKQQIAEQMFTEGRRDEDLFHIAYQLIKAKTPENEILQVLEILAKNCTPPFPEHDIPTKIQSALKRVFRQEKNLAQEVKDWISVTSGYFSVTDCYNELQVVTKCDKANVRQTLVRLSKEGEIERHPTKNGQYRKINTSVEEIDFLNAPIGCVNLKWPFEIEQYVKILPKNIIIVAGVPNSGKTAFLLNFIEMNMDSHNIFYFSSEMGDIELRDRLSKFERPLHSWKFKPIERSSDFADVIRPNDINVIDFLEIHDEFWKISGMIKNIYDKLNKGIAIIAIQKDPHKEYGAGATRSLEKARLYLTMDSHRIKIVKGKNWAKQGVNPNGLELYFKLISGCRFTLEQDWRKS